MNHLVDAVVALQTAVDELAQVEDTLENLPSSMREVHQRYSESKAVIDEIKARIEAANLERRQAEIDATDSQAKLEQLQAQIREVKTQREYGAILAETDLATESKNSAEETALASLEIIEGAESELTPLIESFKEVADEYREHEKSWKAEKPTIEARKVELTGMLEVLREELPNQTRLRFERTLQHTQGHAMSSVVEVDRTRGADMWACSNCSYRIRPQAVVEIRTQGKLLQCDGCRRFLYIAEVPVVEDAPAEDAVEVES